ncbi:MAG TPA: DUF4199 domain-containing protein [Rhizomicrobium sp.]|nr:DUF4199 domain-containing protein [Rhizomicrobium sp.]
MIRNALVFGSISGAIVITGVLLTFLLPNAHGSVWLGYLIMIVALSMILFGVKRYRDNELGGVIRFLPALALGLMIAVVASAVYVVVWEVYLYLTHYSFMDHYTAAMLAKAKADGVTGAALKAEIAELDQMKAQYANPFYRIGETFMEIFPVGFIIALITAVLLRNPKVLPARG